MALLDLILYPDPRLRRKAARVERFDADLGRLVDDLTETLHHHRGIGISATQVDDHRAVLVMDLSEDRNAPREYINPEILSRETRALVEESCLSIPGVEGNVIRHIQVTVRAQDRHGQVFEEELEQMYAVCLQHEMDHLVGKLFIDRLSLVRRVGIRLSAGRRREPVRV